MIRIPPFAFAGSPIDRAAHLRTKPDLLAELAAGASACFVKITDDAAAVHQGRLETSRPGNVENAIFLGQDPEGAPWFVVALTDATGMSGLRALMTEETLSHRELAILAQARSLVHWHRTHGFCANCGSVSVMRDGGYRRHCETCNTDHFPRTDPVVIMAVRLQERLLLGRQKAWPEGMFSALAGFMEPGETIEEAVGREVLEETGIHIGKVQYVASQPWPFPSSLMIGVVAEATSTDITIDEIELESARWFDMPEVRQMLGHKHPQGLYASRPQAIAWHVVRAALKAAE